MELGENMLCKTLPYFIVLASSVKTLEVKAIGFYRIHVEVYHFNLIKLSKSMELSKQVTYSIKTNLHIDDWRASILQQVFSYLSVQTSAWLYFFEVSVSTLKQPYSHFVAKTS